MAALRSIQGQTEVNLRSNSQSSGAILSTIPTELQQFQADSIPGFSKNDHLHNKTLGKI